MKKKFKIIQFNVLLIQPHICKYICVRARAVLLSTSIKKNEIYSHKMICNNKYLQVFPTFLSRQLKFIFWLCLNQYLLSLTSQSD